MKPTPHIVVSQAAARFGFTHAQIVGPSRKKAFARARRIAAYLVREMVPGATTVSVAVAVGRRDHTTAVWACHKVEAQLAAGDPETVADVTAIRAKVDAFASRFRDMAGEGDVDEYRRVAAGLRERAARAIVLATDLEAEIARAEAVMGECP